MKQQYHVGLVMKSLQADFFKGMKEGAEQFAGSLPLLNLICVGTATQTEVAEQIALMHSLINRQVDAIVLVPIDSKALVTPTIEAIQQGILVINIDIPLDEMLLKQAGIEVPFVGPDNLTAAYKVGKCLCNRLRPSNEVAIIEGLAVADNARQRKEGFLKAINEFGLKLVATQPADWETAKAQELFCHIWLQHPTLKGVFCSNDAMALGVLNVMRERNIYLPLVGFDNDAVMNQYLQSGQLVATVDIFGSQMAVRGIEFALKVLQGEAQSKGVHVTPHAIIESSCQGVSLGHIPY